MAKRTCPEGQQWDSLLNICHSWPLKPRPKPPPPPTEPVLTVVDQLRTKTTTLPTVLVLSQTLWICAVLVTLGSFLVLTLWFVIFRRQTRDWSSLEDPAPEQEFLQKTEPPVQFPSRHSDVNPACQRGEETPSPCHHLHPWGQTESQWEDGLTICRGSERQGSIGGGGGAPACGAAADHRVPLPATELGGTVLVTTKTL